MEPSVGDGQMNAGARVARLWEHLVALLQMRLRQAQGDARSAARNLLMGIVFALVALPLLVTTAILALAAVMPAWLAALVVLAVLLLVAAGLLIMARARLRR